MPPGSRKRRKLALKLQNGRARKFNSLPTAGPDVDVAAEEQVFAMLGKMLVRRDWFPGMVLYSECEGGCGGCDSCGKADAPTADELKKNLNFLDKGEWSWDKYVAHVQSQEVAMDKATHKRHLATKRQQKKRRKDNMEGAVKGTRPMRDFLLPGLSLNAAPPGGWLCKAAVPVL